MNHNKNPFKIFHSWLEEAKKFEINDPDAMSLASINNFGMPNVRMVLMRRWDERGFVFFTNLNSQKGKELQANSKVASCFHWKSIEKSVRIQGVAHLVDSKDADEYFHSRPYGSCIGAWASKQSQPLESEYALQKAVASYTKKFITGKVPRPDYWSGFRIKPLLIEFWSSGKFRLHNRLQYSRKNLNSDWVKVNLYP